MTRHETDTHRLIGTLGVEDGKGVVRMEDRVDAGIDDVWSAVTDPARLGHWLGEIEGDLRLGGAYRAHYFASGWEGTGRIVVCEPPHRLRTEVQQATNGKEGTVEVWLTADGDGTRVVTEERGMPAELLAAYGAGIQIHVEDLAAHLAGREIDHSKAGERWEALNPLYEQVEIRRA